MASGQHDSLCRLQPIVYLYSTQHTNVVVHMPQNKIPTKCYRCYANCYRFSANHCCEYNVCCFSIGIVLYCQCWLIHEAGDIETRSNGKQVIIDHRTAPIGPQSWRCSWWMRTWFIKAILFRINRYVVQRKVVSFDWVIYNMYHGGVVYGHCCNWLDMVMYFWKLLNYRQVVFIFISS